MKRNQLLNGPDYWDMRLEQALEYFRVCGHKTETGPDGEIIVTDPDGNDSSHTAMEIISFNEDETLPDFDLETEDEIEQRRRLR